MELTRKLQGPVFEKTAAKFLLGDNPNTYASELIAHLYKQHPYLGQYQVNISIQGQDQSMGFLYGVFLVSQASDVPPPDGQQRMGEVVTQGQPPPNPKESVRIPIIVENKRAYSYDVFITSDGRFLPLSEERIASSMFDSSPYAAAPPLKSGVDSGANENMAPSLPGAASGGTAAGGGVESGPMDKMSSLDVVNIPGSEIEIFLNKIAANQSLVDAAAINESFAGALSKLASVASENPEESSGGLLEDFNAAVVSKVSGGYKVKTAVADGNVESEFIVENKHAEMIPLELRQGVTKHGSVLLTDNNKEELLGIVPSFGLEDVDESGVYSVINKHGTAQKAVVITNIVAMDGKELGLNLVVGPSGASIQEKVAGIRCGEVDLDLLAGGEPVGEGVFILKTAGATSEPVEIKHAVYSGNITEYICEHPLRGRMTVKLAGVLKPTQETETDYLLPEDTIFLPLKFGGTYVEDKHTVDKIATRQDAINKVRLISDGSEFTFSGKPVEHLEKNAGLSSEEALLRIGLLGDTPPGAVNKVASAARGEDVYFVPSRRIITDLPGTEVDEEIAHMASVIQLDLVKEAAALAGADTVDSVLSLNFITPENVQGYIDALPTFEESASKLAELLVGVRLGLSDVPEAAVSSALRGVERAVQGLKKLQIRSNATI